MKENKTPKKTKGNGDLAVVSCCSEEIGQLFFEFKEWAACFESWKRNLPLYGDNMQLVISINTYTEGYYIETKGKELTKLDTSYVGSEVFELEKRIIAEHKQADKEGRHPNLTL